MIEIAIDLLLANCLTCILFIGVGMTNGWKDRSALNRFKRGYWNKSEGWIYKWKIGEDGRRIPITKQLPQYLWKFTPKYREKFWNSSTLFVFLTDGWHLLQLIQFKLAMFAVLIDTTHDGVWQGMYVVLLLSLSFSIGFWITYESKER